MELLCYGGTELQSYCDTQRCKSAIALPSFGAVLPSLWTNLVELASHGHDKWRRQWAEPVDMTSESQRGLFFIFYSLKVVKCCLSDQSAHFDMAKKLNQLNDQQRLSLTRQSTIQRRPRPSPVHQMFIIILLYMTLFKKCFTYCVCAWCGVYYYCNIYNTSLWGQG